MDLKIIALFSLMLLFSCGSKNTGGEKYEVSEEKPVEPKNLFLLHCESCHGLEGNKGTSGAADLQKSKLTLSEIETVIKNGNDKGMMPYKDIITAKGEISALAEYVQTLRK